MASRAFAPSILVIAGFLGISVMLFLLSEKDGLASPPPLDEVEWKKVIREWEKLRGVPQEDNCDSCRHVHFEGPNILVDGQLVGTQLDASQAAGGGLLKALSQFVLGHDAGRGAGQQGNGTRCHPSCHKHGTCNEELGRCDCRASFSGPDCTDLAMPACQLTPEYYTTCTQPTTCQCTIQCQHWAFAASEPCFDADDIPPASDNLTDIYVRRQVMLHTNGKGREVGARWLPPEGPFRPPHRIQDIAACPESCNYRSACSEHGHCMCYFNHEGAACERNVRRWDCPWVQCFNRCSGRGVCHDGFCHCRPGAFGIDCSLSLGPDGIPDVWTNAGQRLPRPPGGLRPLIYVYELPPWLNVWLMTHSLVSLDRHEPSQVLERLLHSPHRTTDPARADFFFVPAWPRWRLIRGAYTERVVEYISTTWPYWKRKKGADHIFVVTDDWGPCDEGGVRMPALAPSMLLNLWGFTGKMADRKPNSRPLEACFALGHDIAIPPNIDWNINKHDRLALFSPLIDPELAQPRTLQLYFSGSSGRRQVSKATATGAAVVVFGLRGRVLWLRAIGKHPRSPQRGDGMPSHCQSPTEWMCEPSTSCPLAASSELSVLQDLTGGAAPDYSFGIRQAIFDLFEARQEELNWKLSEPPDPYPDYLHIMATSVFCFGPPGHGWGTRAVQGVIMGCIPVVVADHIVQPWEGDLLDWSDFSIRVANADMPRLAEILQQVAPEEITQLQEGLRRVWPRFLWHSVLESPLNDAELKPSVRARLEQAVAEEDAFCTIIDILKRRLRKQDLVGD